MSIEPKRMSLHIYGVWGIQKTGFGSYPRSGFMRCDIYNVLKDEKKFLALKRVKIGPMEQIMGPCTSMGSE